ncbi:LysR family transcriptional regulator [Pseudomonas profundi]|uniref:LysR family transcriptional regulator n=1 Tax=Pseudomonas profundi TaxID=1981513 RepID=UPI00123C1410|nr:LysR family transcriptional regulator [Pseudomonas profundi]
MDTALARTFLEIVRGGSFIAAAERLHLTQAAVTARVQSLEAQLNCTLFIRNRSGARLTAEGEIFVVHANQMVQAWDAAQRNLPLPEGHRSVLNLGAEPSLCNPLMLDWVGLLREQIPTHTVRAEMGETHQLMRRVEDGTLDAALVYQPEYLPGLQVEELLEEKLIQVRLPEKPDPYVYIDWGESFRRLHDAALPERVRAPVSFNLGPLGLQYIIENGGAGYFRTRVVQSYLDEGVLERVPQAPEFSFPTYLVYARRQESDALHRAFSLLREVTHSNRGWSRRRDTFF